MFSFLVKSGNKTTFFSRQTSICRKTFSLKISTRLSKEMCEFLEQLITCSPLIPDVEWLSVSPRAVSLINFKQFWYKTEIASEEKTKLTIPSLCPSLCETASFFITLKLFQTFTFHSQLLQNQKAESSSIYIQIILDLIFGITGREVER